GMALLPDGGPPTLARCCRDIAAGVRIFEEWRARFGKLESEAQIRVTIIRGLSARAPHHYAVTVSSELDEVTARRPDELQMVLSRINRMTPNSSHNLDGFLQSYVAEGKYLLVPMAMTERPTPADFRFDLAIGKSRLIIRQAWEI